MNKYLAKLYVRVHYTWYYITHPKMWWKVRQLDQNLKELTNLYIGRTSMNDEIDYTKLGTWIGIMLGGGIFWYSIFFNGFFITITWLIVISAIIALCFRMWDMRL